MNKYTDRAVTDIDEAGSIIANKNITIDCLTEQLATVTEQKNRMWFELAASQAREQQLREALHKLACLGNGAHYGTSDGNRIAQVALALPTDTSALQAIVAKAGEVMRERLLYLRAEGVMYPADIRALPAISLEDLK